MSMKHQILVRRGLSGTSADMHSWLSSVAATHGSMRRPEVTTALEFAEFACKYSSFSGDLQILGLTFNHG
jgi:hypothetical protein